MPWLPDAVSRVKGICVTCTHRFEQLTEGTGAQLFITAAHDQRKGDLEQASKYGGCAVKLRYQGLAEVNQDPRLPGFNP